MTRNTIKLFTSLALLATLAGGCQSIGRITGEETATTGIERVTWDADPGEINPPSPDRRTVYVQFNDATGRDVQMRTELRDELKALGYQIVMTPDTAAYKLQVRITSFDRRECGDRTDGTGRTLSNTGRDATGKVTGELTSGGILETLGEGLGDLIGEGIKNRTKAKEWCLVANFTLAELSPEGVQTVRHSGTVNESGSYSGSANASGASGGSRRTVDGQSQYGVQLKNHWEYRRVLTASTTKWNLSEQEAYEKLLPRLLKAAANALPSAI